MSEAAAPLSRTRSGSQNRRRRHVVNVTFDDDEFAETRQKAEAAGLSLASLLRACTLGSAGPRAQRRPPLNAELLAYAVSALNKAGSNLNQIARTLNAARAVGAQESVAALAETRAAVLRILEIVGRADRL